MMQLGKCELSRWVFLRSYWNMKEYIISSRQRQTRGIYASFFQMIHKHAGFYNVITVQQQWFYRKKMTAFALFSTALSI